jgi:hypothetical protein
VVTAAGLHSLASAAALAGGPPGIGRRAAQRLAHSELSKAIYQPSLTSRVVSWLERQLARLLNGVNGNVPGGWWALIALIVAAVLVVAVVLVYVRPATARRGPDGALLAGAMLSARDHRQLSERLAAAGDQAAAIIERVRAMAVELEERGVLPPKPGRTADEFAAEAGQALPSHAGPLIDAAQLFDDVMYGGRDGTAAGYQSVRDLDASLRAARPASVSALLPEGAATGGPS